MTRPTRSDRLAAAAPAAARRARRVTRPVITLAALPLLGSVAAAQEVPVFSVDWHGPMNGRPGFGTAIPITEGDLLAPATDAPAFGPLPEPFILFDAGQLGLPQYTNCVSQPGVPCQVEVDALSDGQDALLPNQSGLLYNLYFSTDEYVIGFGGGPLPTIQDEGVRGEVCADIWSAVITQPGPIPPPTLPPAIPNVLSADGDGLPGTIVPGATAPGLGLIEPNVPGTGLPNNPFDLGDNLDALNVDTDPLTARMFFSLDAAFFDPFAGVTNSGSAAANGPFLPGDVLQVQLGAGQPTVYAQAFLLGLSNTDDLDALILHENGVPGFQPSLTPYDWTSGTTDMLVFSVRRGSPIIGQLDSIQQIPIEPGDLLVPPLGGPALGTTPGILIPAEALGLSTSRLGLSADDVDALDVEDEPTYHDCNDNEIDDSVDIANGGSADDNMNGVPDECEPPGTGYCYCTTGIGPCGNDYATGGCENSTGGGAILVGTGSSSVFTDDLVLTITQAPPGQFGIFYMGGSVISLPFGDGVRCVGAGSVGIHRFGIQSSGPSGTYTEGPGLVSTSCGSFTPSGCIVVGATWRFQGWYRDPLGPCGFAFNLSNAWEVLFTN